MNNIKIFINELDSSEWVEIDRGNNEYTSMPKVVYEKQYGPITE